MSLLWNYIESRPKETKRLIGIIFDQFNQLVDLAKLAENRLQIELEKEKIRINSKGAGSREKLSISDQILLTLDYPRQFDTFQSLGVKFEVGESTANNIFHKWLPILVSLLPASLLEQVNEKPGALEWVRDILCARELIVDSTEGPIERPLDKENQEEFYSGYKRIHSMKNQFIILPDGEDIVDTLIGNPRPTSDINLFQEREDFFKSEQKKQITDILARIK